MKFLVAYNGSTESKAALDLAVKHASIFKAKVFVITSMEGGHSEKPEEPRAHPTIMPRYRRDGNMEPQVRGEGRCCSRLSTGSNRSPSRSALSNTSEASKRSSSPPAPTSTSSHVTGVDTVGAGRARSE